MAARAIRSLDVLDVILARRSARVPFDPRRKVPAEHLIRILEGARWAPTAHNMQNFEIVVVDDRATLEALAEVRTEPSEVFIEENRAQLSGSEDELKRRKRGLLADMFPPSWRTHDGPHAIGEHAYSILGAPIRNCAALLVVLHDASKRAPASEGDALGMMSLGCVMENMWLVAQSLGVGFQVQSGLGAPRVEADVRRLLSIPAPWRVGFAARIGYPAVEPTTLRVRRDVEDFTHHDRFGARFPRRK